MNGGPYTVEEVLDNFEALLLGTDFSNELAMLRVGRFSVMRRQMLRELRGLFAGLWHLALTRSFPDRAGELFDLFLERHAIRFPGKEEEKFRQRARQYKEMLLGAGDKDFTAVSRHLLSFVRQDEAGFKAMSLRMALHLRSTYTFIFERLI